MRDFCSSLLAGLKRLEHAVTLAAFLVLICVVFADVISREVSGTGLHWARQVGVWANFCVVMFGLGLASSAGMHLRPRFADGWLPKNWAAGLNRAQDGGMALFCLGFAYIALQMTAEGFALQEKSAVLGIVIWPVQAVIPAVFLLASIRHGIFSVYPALRPVTASTADNTADLDKAGI